MINLQKIELTSAYGQTLTLDIYTISLPQISDIQHLILAHEMWDWS